MASAALGELLIWAPAFGVFGCLLYSFYALGVTRLKGGDANRTDHSVPPMYFDDIEKEGNKRRSAFTARRLTPTTFLITEYDDIYSERPFIYVKIVPAADAILILDTGCGGATTHPHVEVTKLRDFIEKVNVEDNEGKPLNEGGKKEEIILLTHCHYDHILAVEQFADCRILASGHSPSFLSPSNLPAHSLCDALGIHTPSYMPTLVPHLYSIHSSRHVSLGITVLHTPGHTPDELAVWDENEGMLYVGDTLYEHDPIIFPKQGSIIVWLQSVDYLISLVRARAATGKTVRINCGHSTAARPALDVLEATKSFMEDVLSGKEPVRERTERRGEQVVAYKQESGRFALVCPERLVLEARAVQVA